MARLAPSYNTIKQLLALSGNRCAFPGCDNHIINGKGKVVAQVCHIEGVKGERYNPMQTDEQRRAPENLVLFCYKHHVETNDVIDYPVERLRQIKADHENQFRDKPFKISTQRLDGVLDQFHDQFEKLETKLNSVATDVSEIKELVLDFSLRHRVDAEKYHIEQLDTFKELKKRQKHRTALDLLLRFKADKWPVLSSDIRYKVLINLAICYFDLQETRMACDTIIGLLEVPGEQEDKCAFLTMAYAIKNDRVNFEYWFQKTCGINKANVNAWIAYITIYREAGHFDETVLPPAICEQFEIIFNLGDFYLRAGDRTKGIAYLKTSLEKLQDTPQRVATTKAVIGTRLIQNLVTPFKYVHKHFSGEEALDLEAGFQLLTEAWDVLKNTEMAHAHFFTVMNRGVLHKIRREYDHALMDFEKAYELSPQLQTFRNVFLLYLQLEKYSLAESLLSAQASTPDLSADDLFELDFLRAKLLVGRKNMQDGIALLEQYTQQADARCFTCLPIIIIFLLQKGELALVPAFLEKMDKFFPGKIHTHLLYAGYYELLKEPQKALDHYRQAHALTGADANMEDVYQLATGYMNCGQFREAAIEFDKIAYKDVFNAISFGLIQAHYKAGDVGAALQLALPLFEKDKSNALLAEMIISVYHETHNIDKAIDTFEAAIPFIQGSLKDVFLLKGAKLYFFKQELKKMRQLVMDINDITNLSQEDTFELVDLLQHASEPERAFNVAYEARTRFYDNVHAHEAYVFFAGILGNLLKDQMTPAIVRPECTVTLQSPGSQEIIYIITDLKTEDGQVIPTDDAFSRQLYGKQIGDEIIMEKAYGIRESNRVVAITDKWTYAARVSSELLNTRFAHQTGFSLFQAKPGEPDDPLIGFIQKMSIEQNEKRRPLVSLYERREIPIGTFASLARQNMVQQWMQLASSNNLFIYCYSGTGIPIIQSALEDNRPVVIDLTVLLTQFFVFPDNFILDLLPGERVVSQGTLHELQVFADELAPAVTQGLASIAYENGGLVCHQVSPEIIRRQLETVNLAITWCRDKATIKAPAALLSINREERKHKERTLHPANFETMLLAEEVNGVLLSDDDVFRRFAQAQYAVTGFSLFEWAVHITLAGQLSREAMEKFRLQLVLHNYIHIPPTPAILWKTYEIAGFQVRRPFTAAIKGLMVYKWDALAGATALFFRDLYSSVSLPVTRDQVVLFVLHELSTHNLFSIIKPAIVVAIEEAFIFLPMQKADLLNLVGQF